MATWLRHNLKDYYYYTAALVAALPYMPAAFMLYKSDFCYTYIAPIMPYLASMPSAPPLIKADETPT